MGTGKWGGNCEMGISLLIAVLLLLWTPVLILLYRLRSLANEIVESGREFEKELKSYDATGTGGPSDDKS